MPKIPRKKRNRPKDVLQMIERRSNLMTSKTNLPPRDPKTQDVPNSLKEFVSLKALANSQEKSSKKISKNKPTREKNNDSFSSSKNNLERKNKNSNNKFNAIEGSSKVFTDLEKTENEFGVVKQDKRKKKKLQKLKAKRKLKELRKMEENQNEVKEAESEFQKDDIKFGEVVHRPPNISTRPRKVAIAGFENRPGRKDDLLLKSVINRKSISVSGARKKIKKNNLS